MGRDRLTPFDGTTGFLEWAHTCEYGMFAKGRKDLRYLLEDHPTELAPRAVWVANDKVKAAATVAEGSTPTRNIADDNETLYSYIIEAVKGRAKQVILKGSPGDGVGAWVRLCNAFSPMDKERRSRLVGELSAGFKVSTDDDVRKLVDKIQDVLRQLRNFTSSGDGNLMSFYEDVALSTIRRELPRANQHWDSKMLGFAKDIKLDDILEELAHECEVLKSADRKSRREPVMAFRHHGGRGGRGRGRGRPSFHQRSRQSSRPKNSGCYRCGSTDHFIRDCTKSEQSTARRSQSQRQGHRDQRAGPPGNARQGRAFVAQQPSVIRVQRRARYPTVAIAMHAAIKGINNEGFLIDTGASKCIVNDEEIFSSYHAYAEEDAEAFGVIGVSGNIIAPLGRGLVVLEASTLDGGTVEMRFFADLFPNSPVNVLSAGAVRHLGFTLHCGSATYLEHTDGSKVALEVHGHLPFLRSAIEAEDDEDDDDSSDDDSAGDDSSDDNASFEELDASLEDPGVAGTLDDQDADDVFEDADEDADVLDDQDHIDDGDAIDVLGGAEVMAAIRDVRVSSDLQMWHERFNHGNFRAVVAELKKHGVEGIKLPTKHSCEVCILSKLKKAKVPPRRTTKDSDLKPGQVLNADFIPMPIVSIRGYCVALLLLDSATGYCDAFLMTERSQAPQALTLFMKRLRRFGVEEKSRMRCDHDSVFTGKDWLDVCSEFGILNDPASPKSQYSNGRVEALVNHVVDLATAIVERARLATDWWGFALKHVCSVLNMTTLYREVAPITKMSSGRVKPDPLSLRKWGAPAYVHIDKTLRQKMDSKARRGCLVGYDCIMNAYQIFFPNTMSLVDSRHVRILENAHYLENHEFPDDEHISEDEDDIEDQPAHGEDITTVEDGTAIATAEDDVDDGNGDAGTDDQHPIEETTDDVTQGVADSGGEPSEPSGAASTRRSTRNTARIDYAMLDAGGDIDDELEAAPPVMASINTNNNNQVAIKEIIPEPSSIPMTYQQAMSRPEPEAKHWRKAIDSELQSLIGHGTWTPRPIDELTAEQRGRIIGTRFVFAVKRDATGRILRYKARFVARGFTQTEGLDYQQSSSPVPTLASVRTALAVTSANNLSLRSVDVSTAFLHAEIDTADLHIRLPPALSRDDQGNALVGLLRKGIYGLKQAGYLWYHHFSDFLLELGFQRAESDPCLFYRDSPNGAEWMLVYVDDCLIITRTNEAGDNIVKEIRSQFKITDDGRPSQFLGMNLSFNNEQTTLSLTKYISELAEEFGMTNSNPVTTPMVAGLNLSTADAAQTEEERLAVANGGYQRLVGSLNWASSTCRPDISFAVAQLARFIPNAGMKHLKAARRVLRYLWTTRKVGLVFGPTENTPMPTVHGIYVDAFTDADLANDVDTRKSISGVLVRINGTAVCWASKRQSLTALSTAESELYAAMETTKWTLFLRHLLTDFGIEVPTTSVYTDSAVLVAMTLNRNVTVRTRHLDTRRHRLHDHTNLGDIQLIHLPGTENPADALTKSLSIKLFETHTSDMGLYVVDNSQSQ